ncbi:MAG: molybdopterin oxidoreductase family protein [Eubacteriales bacterium]|nr:molybdopterin oxidoreductase family protein [Eubacteriales bacterium]
MKKVQSICNYCAIDCSLDFFVNEDANQIEAVKPTPGYPVNDGFCCIKGLSLDKQQTVVDKPHTPRVRMQDGSYAYPGWDYTFAYIAKRFREIQEKYGYEAIAGISTGQLTMEEFAINGHILRDHMHTNVDGNTRLCMASAVVAHKQSYGFDAPGYTLKDLELSDTIILIGSNPVVAHPIVWDRIRKNTDKKLIVIDPRRSETAKNADYHYRIKSKMDSTLFYGLANYFISNDLIDHAFIETHTNRFEEYKEFVKDFPMEKVAADTDLSVDEIHELIELIKNGKRVSMWWTMGINQSHNAVRAAQSIINLQLLLGNYGKPGTGANSITGQCNAMGSRLFSNQASLYGHPFDNPDARKKVAGIFHCDEEILAKGPTKTYNQIIEGINNGDIKALWIICTNPRHSWTNNVTFKKAIENLEFYVVQDIYDDIESADDYDVFLPAVPGIKKEGTYVNLERRLGRMIPALKPDEDEKNDYQIMYGIAKAMGFEDIIEYWKTPEDCFNLMRACSKGRPFDFTGVSYRGLEFSHGVQWPFREGEVLEEDERRLYADGKFFHPDGKAVFMFEPVPENPLPQTEEFPYIFNTGRGSVGQWHTQSRTREVQFVEGVSAHHPYCYIHPAVADKFGLKHEDWIMIHSCNGESAPFAVRVTDDVKEDEIYCPIHYIECNRLTPSVYDPYSKEPSYKAAVVNIRPVEEGFVYVPYKN